MYAKITEPLLGAPVDPSTLKLIRIRYDLDQLTVIDEMKVQLNVVAGSADRYTVTGAPYPPSVEWGILPDGRLVVGQSDKDYFRILSPEGNVLREVHIPADAPPVTDENRKSYFGRFISGGTDHSRTCLR